TGTQTEWRIRKQKSEEAAVKPEGFTEYSRRQSPPWAGAAAGWHSRNRPTLKASQSPSATHSVGQVKDHVAAASKISSSSKLRGPTMPPLCSNISAHPLPGRGP